MLPVARGLTGLGHRGVAPRVVRGFAASPWGGDTWRHDKHAFKAWTQSAMQDSSSKEGRELYGFLALSFGDADADKDGWINKEEFDGLLEKVASLPRRYGMAPSWQAQFGNDVNERIEARNRIFDSIDGSGGFTPRGKLAMGQFITWCHGHIFQKVQTIDDAKVDFANLSDYTEDQFINYLELAVTDPTSGASTSLYNFLLTIFTEADVKCKGTVNFSEFDRLATLAAAVPRHFGLAPSGSDEATRKAMFDAMDHTNSGTVTFRKFLRFVRLHAKAKIEDHKAGKGFKSS